MKKFILLPVLLIVGLFLDTKAQRDSVLFFDDFESYTVGGYVADQGDPEWWTTWSGAPGSSEDALVSDVQNHTTGGSKSAHTQGNTTDLVLLLGNQTSGVYEISFYYYVPSGKGAYFNIQHTENMGEEWAFECFFSNDGNGYLVAEGSNHSFTHPLDEWIHVVFKADLDQDSAYLWINDNKILQWVFSHKSDGTQGLKQLGGVDFYAGAPSGQTPEWYLDDVEYKLLVAGAEPPELTLNTDSIATNGSPFLLHIQNDGEQDLVYDIYVRYPNPNGKVASYNNVQSIANQKTIYLGKLNSVENKKLEEPIKVNLPKDVTLTHLQGDIASNLGFSSAADVLAAALFKSDVMKDYIGMNLNSLIIYVGDLPTSGSTYAKVWLGRKYSVPGPIEEVASQAFTPADANSQNPITLDNPVFINGDDLWFGWAFHDPGDGTYPLPMDQGPPIDDANWLKYGPSWSELTNPSFGNFGLVGTLTGDTIPTWVVAQYGTAGQIAPGQGIDIPILFDVSNLDTTQTYTAELVIRTNDPDDDEDFVVVPITLSFANEPSKVESSANIIQTYPNPATNYYTITSTNTIEKVQFYTIDGKLAKQLQPNTTVAKINVSDLSSGLYIVKIKTEKTTKTEKLIIE